MTTRMVPSHDTKLFSLKVKCAVDTMILVVHVEEPEPWQHFWAPKIATLTSSMLVFQIPRLDAVATCMNTSSILQVWVQFGLKLQRQIAKVESRLPILFVCPKYYPPIFVPIIC